MKRLSKIEKEIADINIRKEKLLDLRLENNLDRDIYEKKNQELSGTLTKLFEEQRELLLSRDRQKDAAARLKSFRNTLASGDILEEFDRVVFESVVEKIIIGGYNEDGTKEPLKITFVYKTGIHSEQDGKNFKPRRKNAAGVHTDTKLCSYDGSEGNKLYPYSSLATSRDGGIVNKERYGMIFKLQGV